MVSSLFLIVQFLSLCFWVGSSFSLIVIVAPPIFKNAPSRQMAGNLMSPILERFASFFIPNALLLLGMLYFQTLVLGTPVELKLKLAISLVGVGVLIAMYEKFVVSVRINELRQALAEVTAEEFVNHDHRREFSRLHGRSMVLFMTNFFVGVAIVCILIVPM